VSNEFKEIELEQGVIRYREYGSGEPIVFVHGLLVNGNLWRKVVPPLSKEFRCIIPDWPLGSHSAPMNSDADLTPIGVAKIISDFLSKLDLSNVTLVGNDTGGALCQIVITEHPEKISRLVLTNCDVFDNFLPLMFRYLEWGAYIPGFVFLLSQSVRLKLIRRLPFAYGLLTKFPIDDEIMDLYLNPVIYKTGIRRDVGKVLRGISPKYTLNAVKKFSDFKKPVLITWAPEDRFFPIEYAKKLAECFSDARLELIENSYTFISEDKPQKLAEIIEFFLNENK
jgi:pimeloyl-ACP methyl ester carboxylesterase